MYIKVYNLWNAMTNEYITSWCVFSGRPIARDDCKCGGLLQWATGNKIDNIMVVRSFIIPIKHHSNSPITIVTLFGKSDKLYMLMSTIIYTYTGSISFLLAKLIDK